MGKNYIQANAQVIKVRKELLSLHPILAKIYTYNDLDAIEDLAKTIMEVGQREPIIINHNYQILSGGRRWMAINKIDNLFELDAIVSADNGKDESLNIVCHNQQREKTREEILNEFRIISPFLTKRQGQRNDLKKDEAGNPLGIKGKDRFEIAAKIIGGISGSSMRQLSNIEEFTKESLDNKKLGLLDKVMSGEISFSKGDAIVKKFREIEDEKTDCKPISINTIFNETDVNIYNKSCIDMSEVETESVQVVKTSVPYYALRNYGNGVNGVPELGLEATPDEFITNLVNHLRDVKRVLKDTGSFFLNIGESYQNRHALLIPIGVVSKLCKEEGWYLVNEIIWKKNNPSPQTLTSRLHNTYEKIFHLVKNPDKYYYREFKMWNNEPIKLMNLSGYRDIKENRKKEGGGYTLSKPYKRFKDFIEEQKVHDIIVGNNAGIRQKELNMLDNKVDHPALFPDYLPVIPILTTSKPGDIILDPFSGSATTGRTALLLGRKYIGYELNKENYELSKKDIHKAMQETSTSNMEEIFQMAA